MGLTVAGVPFFLGEPENNGWDTPATVGSRTVRVEAFVDDPDGFIDGAVAAGADGSVDQIRDHKTPWGIHRQGGFIDPIGHLWLVGGRSAAAHTRFAITPHRAHGTGERASTEPGPLRPPASPPPAP